MKPLVHPLDVPEARHPFLWSWLVGALAAPPVALCVAGLVWFASQSYVAPILAGAALLGFGALASRHLSGEAWAFIPRRRQDRGRPLPIAWELAAALVTAVLLTAVLLLAAFRLGRPDITLNVRAFAFGMAAAVGALVVIDLAAKLVLRHGGERRAAAITAPGVLAVVVCVAVAYEVLLGPAGPASVGLMAWGAGVMLGLGALTAALRRVGLVR